jgi:hypothetical protein
MQERLYFCQIHTLYHGRVKAEKISRPSVMDKTHQFAVKDLDNNIQFLCLIKTIQKPQNVAQTQLKIRVWACY